MDCEWNRDNGRWDGQSGTVTEEEQNARSVQQREGGVWREIEVSGTGYLLVEVGKERTGRNEVVLPDVYIGKQKRQQEELTLCCSLWDPYSPTQCLECHTCSITIYIYF